MSKFKAGDNVIILKSNYRGEDRQPGCVITLVKKARTGYGQEVIWTFKDKSGYGTWSIEEKNIRHLTKLEKALK